MLTGPERSDLKRLIVEELEKAQFEAMLRTNLVQEPARFTQSTDFGDIAEAAIRSADAEGWMPNLLATLIYERQSTNLGAQAMALGVRYVGQGSMQTLVTEVDALYDWSIMARRVSTIGRHVCLIEIDHVAEGTGVLVGPDLVLTAQHVINPLMPTGNPAPLSAKRLSMTFDFTTTELPDGTRRLNPGTKYAVADSWLVAHSPPHPQEIAKKIPPDTGTITEFDYALMRLAEKVGDEALPALGAARGWAAVAAAPRPLGILQRIHIAQHPAGQFLQGSSGRISTIPPHNARIRYKASTLNVSSGAPCWNNDYELIALHNFGGATTPNGVENQGVPIERIKEQLTRSPTPIVLPSLPSPIVGGAPPRANSAAAGVTAALSRMWTLGAEYPILNRNQLQQAMAAVVSESGSQILVVRGKRYTGRSFTTKVVQQYLRPFGHIALTIPAAGLMEKKPEDVLLELRSTLSLPAPVAPVGADLTTRPAQIGRHLLNGFFADLRAKYPAKPALPAQPMQVWLLLDGLDQVRLAEETHDLVAEIVQRLGEVPVLRLVLIGYDRELPSEVDATVEKENIAEVSASDIEAHIEYICRSKMVVLPLDRLKALAASVLAAAPAEPAHRLAEIARLVRDVVRKLSS